MSIFSCNIVVVIVIVISHNIVSHNMKVHNYYPPVSVPWFIYSCRLVIIVSLGFGIVKPRLGPLLNR